MNNEHSTAGLLDRIRKSRGANACKEKFRELCNSGKPLALQAVNSPGLSFATFYLLLPDIRNSGLTEELSDRGRLAERFCEIIANNGKANREKARPAYDEAAHEALRWMFLTGAPDDGLEDGFDRILDIAASILTKVYRDPAVLPDLVRLIFQRNRKGTCVHDLAWAFFQSRSPRALRLAAEYLRSPDSRDIRLARVLLHLGQEENQHRARRAQYADFLQWLNENGPYLHFTGESFNLAGQPNVCLVDLGAKYLCHAIAGENHELRPSLTEREQSLLTDFANARSEEKELLARFSRNMRVKDSARWERWIRYPLEKQLKIAKDGGRRPV